MQCKVEKSILFFISLFKNRERQFNTTRKSIFKPGQSLSVQYSCATGPLMPTRQKEIALKNNNDYTDLSDK